MKVSEKQKIIRALRNEGVSEETIMTVFSCLVWCERNIPQDLVERHGTIVARKLRE